MASVGMKNGSYFVRVVIDKTQTKIYTGLKDSREADRLADKIQRLADSKRNGMNLTESGLAEWVKKLETGNSKVYEKLVSLGLLEQKARPVTVGDICKHYVKRADKKHPWTQYHYEKTAARLCEYFGENKPVAEITTDDAYKFEEWFKTAPLNERTGNKPSRPLGEETVNREMKNFKSVFGYALKLGIIQFNPFAVIQVTNGGTTENKTYVSVQDVLDVIQAETTPLKWKVIIALGRFAGCRGACDLCELEWSDVIFSDAEKKIQGKITLKGKTAPGTIPLSPVLESLLREWQGAAFLENEDSQKLFPEIKEGTNVGTMTEKSIKRTGKEVWERPWYSLRASFCIDVMNLGLDPKTYSYLCRHSPQTALQYYQKYTEHRERTAGKSMASSPLWGAGAEKGSKNSMDSVKENAKPLAECRTLEDLKWGLKWGLAGVLKGALQGGAFNSLDVQKIREEINDVLENTLLEVTRIA